MLLDPGELLRRGGSRLRVTPLSLDEHWQTGNNWLGAGVGLKCPDSRPHTRNRLSTRNRADGGRVPDHATRLRQPSMTCDKCHKRYWLTYGILAHPFPRMLCAGPLVSARSGPLFSAMAGIRKFAWSDVSPCRGWFCKGCTWFLPNPKATDMPYSWEIRASFLTNTSAPITRVRNQPPPFLFAGK